MIQAIYIGDEVQISVNADRGPRLYLDQFAILHFASNVEHRERFLTRFETHGELLFSHMNLMEVGLLRGGSATRVREFLRRIGVHWVPLEFDVHRVVPVEFLKLYGSEPPRHPALSSELLEFVYRSGTNRDELVTLDKVITVYSAGDVDAHRAALNSAKACMTRAVADWQKLTPAEMDCTFPLVQHAGPTLSLLSQLIRSLIQEAKAYRWMPNDAFDFAHSLVPLDSESVCARDRG